MTLMTKVGGTALAAALALTLTSCASETPAPAATKAPAVQSAAPAAATPTASAAPTREKAKISAPKVSATDRSRLGEAVVKSAWKFGTDFIVQNTFDPELLAKSREEVTDADLLRITPLMTEVAAKAWRKQTAERNGDSPQGLMFYGAKGPDRSVVTPKTVTDLTIFGDVSLLPDGHVLVTLQHSAKVHTNTKGKTEVWNPSVKTTFWLTEDGSSWKIDDWRIRENRP